MLPQNIRREKQAHRQPAQRGCVRATEYQ